MQDGWHGSEDLPDLVQTSCLWCLPIYLQRTDDDVEAVGHWTDEFACRASLRTCSKLWTCRRTLAMTFTHIHVVSISFPSPLTCPGPTQRLVFRLALQKVEFFMDTLWCWSLVQLGLCCVWAHLPLIFGFMARPLHQDSSTPSLIVRSERFEAVSEPPAFGRVLRQGGSDPQGQILVAEGLGYYQQENY